MKESDKKIKFQDRILGELNVLLRGSLSDSRLQFASFTKVELNNDFSEAKVYWDTFDQEKREGIDSAMKAARSKLRALLANNLNVRHTPSLTMVYDNQFESEQEILKLLGDEEKAGKSF